MDNALWSAIDKRIRQLDIDGAIVMLENMLTLEKSERFSSLIGARFTNPPEQMLAFINNFIQECENDFKLKAIYLEMNGFDINCDLWFFSPFGYNTYESDLDDLDWLSEWQSEDDETFLTLTGLESVQADFAWYCEEKNEKDESHARAHEIATLLVMVKFIALIRSALASGPLAKSIPILATAHDFDIVGRFLPTTFLQRCMQLIKGR